MEDARTWAALAAMYDNSFVATATGAALTVLGAELGLPRPFLEAPGTVTLALAGNLPAGDADLLLPRGPGCSPRRARRRDRTRRRLSAAEPPGRRASRLQARRGRQPRPAVAGAAATRTGWNLEPLDPKLADLSPSGGHAGAPT